MGVHLRRVLSVVVVLVVLIPERAVACAICFGNTESPLLDSARLGVLAMAGVTVTVLGVFGAWFVRLARLEGEATLDTGPDSSIQHPDPQSAVHNPRSL